LSSSSTLSLGLCTLLCTQNLNSLPLSLLLFSFSSPIYFWKLTLKLYLPLSVCLSLSVYICLSVNVCLSLAVCLSLSVSLFLYLPFSVSLWLYVSLSLTISLSLSLSFLSFWYTHKHIFLFPQFISFSCSSTFDFLWVFLSLFLSVFTWSGALFIQFKSTYYVSVWLLCVQSAFTIIYDPDHIHKKASSSSSRGNIQKSVR